ncbi:hypothetical protein IEQ34_006840 [Dendrobium chrysotoxum]|uniref:Uncharacterized protein n=1 Tax=Dendrobium chrysotoxum TaxID=161865 RepID=A0AAV7GRI4_DENCH|nr:hypothetical protein IEQ34_006840 [Dendrobium chrysotoxum]
MMMRNAVPSMLSHQPPPPPLLQPPQAMMAMIATLPPIPPPQPHRRHHLLKSGVTLLRQAPEVVEFYNSLMKQDTKTYLDGGVSDVLLTANVGNRVIGDDRRKMIGEIENISVHIQAVSFISLKLDEFQEKSSPKASKMETSAVSTATLYLKHTLFNPYGLYL